jgi:hypothetical protein
MDLLLGAVAERLSRFARLRGLRAPAREAGALRARLYAAGAIRSETVLPDGGLEWLVQLPDQEARELSTRQGVEVFDAPQPCAPADGYLQSPSHQTA